MRKIWGIGLSRTGTTSLARVLKDAGLNVIHYPSEQQMFFGLNNGACDIPVIPNYKKLDMHFPNSKFIYTTRDVDDWLDSIVPYFERKKTWNQSKNQIKLREQVYGSAFPNVIQAKYTWITHKIDVYRYFKDRESDLLILDIIGGDSPKKLFDFLGLDNPPDKFPHENRLTK
jgi:hypothetical protein